MSLHLGRIKMSLSKLKFKWRVIWTEKCGLTFHFLYRLSQIRAQQTYRGRPLAMSAYRKNTSKETSFLRQKIDQKRSWMETLTSRKRFLRCIFLKTRTLKKRLGVFFLFCNNWLPLAFELALLEKLTTLLLITTKPAKHS